jgi:EXLDI family protein
MPNKTIYVADGDLPLFQRAQELVGGNLSAAITTALRRLIELEEGRQEGFDEVVVKVGPGVGRKVRFVGVLLGEWGRAKPSGLVEEYRVYRSRTGKYVVHLKRSDEYKSDDMNWRSWIGLDASSWGVVKGDQTLTIFDTLEELKAKVPNELYEIVANLAEEPAVEDLDI